MPASFRLQLAACALLTAGAAAAPAQEAPPAAAPATAEPDAATLEAITVTGRRDSELRAPTASAGVLGALSLIETPFSVNVITRSLIEKQQAAFLGDFLKNDPSASVGNVAVPFATLRGFSLGTDGSLYDGLPGHGGLTDGRAGVQFIDHVDVFKGASAFLHGLGAATSLGGVLNYVPKRPTDAPVRSVQFGVVNRSLLNAEADLGDRFGEDRAFGYRLNVGLRDGEQAVARYDWTQKVAALALDWRATPSLLLQGGFEYVENHTPSLPPFYIVGPTVVPKAPDARRSAAMSWDDFRTRATNHYARADWTLAPDWTVTAQALHSVGTRPRVKEARFGSIDDLDGNVTLFGSEDASETTTDSGQVLLHGAFATGALKHRLTVGLSGMRDRNEGVSDFLGVFPSNLYAPVDAPEPAGAPSPIALTSRTRSTSVLLSDIVEFDAHWSVLVGARRARLSVENFGTDPSRHETTRTLPVAALMYKPSAASLLYVNYAEGLEQGGAVSPTSNSQFLPPIRTEQVEVGAKLDLADLTLAAALFDMRRPLEQFDAGSGLNVQRGEQRHRGLELTANGRVTRALNVVAGLMLLDTETTGTGDAASDGRHVLGVPRVNANLWAEYRLAGVHGLAFNAGVYHAGHQYLDGANAQRVPSFTRLDLGASYETRVAGTDAVFMLNVENAADRSYWASAQSGILTIGDPRTVKLGVRLNF